MDIENFNQCIQYLEMTIHDKSMLERYIPILAALSGGLVGFFLNSLSTRKKETKSDKNKMMCCDEDIQKIIETLNDTILELMRMMVALVEKNKITSNQLPLSISSLYLSSYFIEIAHKYTTDQRLWIQSLMENLSILDKKLAVAQHPEKGFLSFKNSINIVNTLNYSFRARMYCQSVLHGENLLISESESDKHALLLGATEEQVKARNTLKQNILDHNNLLNLD